MNRLEQSELEGAAALASLARVFAKYCRHLDDMERDDVVDSLVTLGFDDSDEPSGLLARIEGGGR